MSMADTGELASIFEQANDLGECFRDETTVWTSPGTMIDSLRCNICRAKGMHSMRDKMMGHPPVWTEDKKRDRRMSILNRVRNEQEQEAR